MPNTVQSPAGCILRGNTTSKKPSPGSDSGKQCTILRVQKGNKIRQTNAKKLSPAPMLVQGVTAHPHADTACSHTHSALARHATDQRSQHPHTAARDSVLGTKRRENNAIDLVTTSAFRQGRNHLIVNARLSKRLQRIQDGISQLGEHKRNVREQQEGWTSHVRTLRGKGGPCSLESQQSSVS